MHVQRRSADTLIANPSYALQDFGFNTSPYPVRDPCSESYAGAKPFEALETQALSRYMLDEQNNIKLFFDLHSYGQHGECGACLNSPITC